MPLLLFFLEQQLPELRHERKRPHAGLRLGRIRHNLDVLAVKVARRDSVPDRDGIGIEVDGVPLEAEHLAAAQTIRYDFEDADYADSEDRETAKLDWGGSILSTNSATSTYVRNLQTRLNYLGYNAGSVDGRFGTNTKNAVMALQQNARAYFNLAVDGKVGDQTKEALTFPKAWLV